MKTIAIYHKDCIDGTTAAAVVRRKFPDAKLFPLSHGYKPEEIEPILKEASPGDQILTVDCVMGVKEFLAAGFPIKSIDHHIGARDEYKKLSETDSRFTYVFDNDKSGASLSWVHLFPDEKMPEIIKYVEDRDIWKFRYSPDTENINHILWLSTNKPEEIGRLFDTGPDDIKALSKEGGGISKYTKKMLDEIVEDNEPTMLRVGEYEVPSYNTTAFKSEMGNILSVKDGKAVALYSIKGGDVRISFRSKDGQEPSALELAKALGGGGHRNASSAKISLPDFIKILKVSP